MGTLRSLRPREDARAALLQRWEDLDVLQARLEIELGQVVAERRTLERELLALATLPPPVAPPPSNADAEPEYITIQAAAKRYSVSTKVLYALADRGVLEDAYFGTARRLKVASLAAYLARQTATD